MRAIRNKDMSPEITVRRVTHGLGYRYRLHRRALPGCPDLVFPSRRKVIFVHGCFWHQHASKTCKIARMPKSNQNYWTTKLKRNVDRDSENQLHLREMGWEVVVIWECETKELKALRKKISKFLSRKPLIPLNLDKPVVRVKPYSYQPSKTEIESDISIPVTPDELAHSIMQCVKVKETS